MDYFPTLWAVSILRSDCTELKNIATRQKAFFSLNAHRLQAVVETPLNFASHGKILLHYNYSCSNTLHKFSGRVLICLFDKGAYA